nr:hypothetical protein CFP56_50199 [Quercus suber]
MEGRKVDDVGGGLIMVDAATLDTVRETITSNHGEQERLNRWDNTTLVGLKMGLEQVARDKQKADGIELVRKEVHGNEKVKVEVGKEFGPVIRELEVLSPIKPKEKEETSEGRESAATRPRPN